MYEYKTTVKLHETDAAGILFFSHQFKLLHDAYETLLEKMGLGFAVLIRERPYFLPIVHASCDYKAPLFVGDRLTIQIEVERIGTTSFTFVYRILNDKGGLAGTGKTVHVTIDKQTRQKIPIPAQMREAITKFKETQLGLF
jgi:1,4-dihydroxy-2-naphthoyl-CoA hydrolase